MKNGFTARAEITILVPLPRNCLTQLLDAAARIFVDGGGSLDAVALDCMERETLIL